MGRSNAIVSILIRGRFDYRRGKGDVTMESDIRVMWLEAKERQCPLAARKGREMDSLLEPSERNTVLLTYLLTYRTIK